MPPCPNHDQAAVHARPISRGEETSSRRGVWRALDLFRSDGLVYLSRRGLQSRWGNVYLHRLDVEDPGQDLHDHPWWFASIILWGGYTELVMARADAPAAARIATRWPDTCQRGYPRTWRAGSIHTMPLDLAHRIVAMPRRTWTLCITGPKVRPWGFLTPDGWVDQADYDHPTLRALDVQDAAAS